MQSLAPFDLLRQITRSRIDSLDLQKIHQAGVRKERKMFASSTIQVAYPPLAILPAFTEEAVSFLSLKKEATVYVHIPFCTGICSYCNFVRHVRNGHSPEVLAGYRHYIATVLNELDMLLDSRQSNLRQQKVSALYFGGGTPTLLGPELLNLIIVQVSKRLDMAPDAEITVECSPETLTSEVLAAARAAGTTRLSIGVESFDDQILPSLKRRHTGLEAEESIQRALDSRIQNVNLDLIRNLPGQTYESIYHDLEVIARLGVPSVTNYHLIVKPQTKFASVNERQPDFFLDEATSIEQHIFIREGLDTLGYQEEPIDWFTLKPEDFAPKHQRSKWKADSDLVGIGVSSYSYHNDVQCYNYRNQADYERAVLSGRLPIQGALRLSNREAFHRRIVFGLRYGICVGAIEEQYGLSITDLFHDSLIRLTEADLIIFDGSYLGLTPKGSLFADEVMAEFYSPEIRGRLVL